MTKMTPWGTSESRPRGTTGRRTPRARLRVSARMVNGEGGARPSAQGERWGARGERRVANQRLFGEGMVIVF